MINIFHRPTPSARCRVVLSKTPFVQAPDQTRTPVRLRLGGEGPPVTFPFSSRVPAAASVCGSPVDDNATGAQTGRPGAVRPVMVVLGDGEGPAGGLRRVDQVIPRGRDREAMNKEGRRGGHA